MGFSLPTKRPVILQIFILLSAFLDTPSTGYPRLGSLQVDAEMGVFNGAQHLWETKWLG